MNLYLVERTDNWSYDMFDSFICSAENAEQARAMWPDDYRVRDGDKVYFVYHDGSRREETGEYLDWPKSEKDIVVVEIGKSNSNEAKVLLGSFNAG